MNYKILPELSEIDDHKHKSPDSPGKSLSNILFNIVIPVFILTKGSGEEYLGPLWGLVVALFFPLSYGAFELISHKKWNFISLLGLVSVLLTGGLVLLKLEGFWFAVKEAAIPAIIGIGVLSTSKSKYNIVRMTILNPQVFELEKILKILKADKQLEAQCNTLLLRTTYLLFLSFLVSALLNFFLAIYILKSPTGTEAFNAELGKMTALSFPVIMVPTSLILIFSVWYLFRGISRLTGVEFNELIKAPESN